MTRCQNNEVNNYDVDDDDEPLLLLDDEPLLLLDDESTTSSHNPTDPIGFRLQSILYHYLAMPVIEGRIVIFCLYLFVLGGSALLMSKIKVCSFLFVKMRSNQSKSINLPRSHWFGHSLIII